MKNFIKKHFLLVLAIIYFLWPLDLLPGVIFDDLAAILAASIIELGRNMLSGKKKEQREVIDGEEVKKDKEAAE